MIFPGDTDCRMTLNSKESREWAIESPRKVYLGTPGSDQVVDFEL